MEVRFFCAYLLGASFFAGCGLIIDAEEWPASGLSVGEDAAETVSSSEAGSTEEADAPASTEDAMPQTDPMLGSSGTPQGPPPWPVNALLGCSETDSSTPTLFDFASDPTEAGGHTGLLELGGSTLLRARPSQYLVQLDSSPGLPQACGRAAGMRSDKRSYFLLPADPRWRLQQGSVDFWFMYTEDASGLMGLLSRDALGVAESGHLSVVRCESGECEDRFEAGKLVMRVQNSDSAQECGGDANCIVTVDDPTQKGSWYHLLVNIGPPAYELYLDGVKLAEIPVNALGIDGNNEPWVFGANRWFINSGEETATYEEKHRGFHMARLRISPERRTLAP